MKQYQIGGALTYVPNIANPFSSAAVADQTAAAETSKSSKNQGLLPDKVMEKILENGIPVDVDNFMNQLAALEQQAAMGINVNKSALYSLQAEANRIVQQHSYLKKAEETAEKNEAIGEIAVGDKGQLFTLSNNGDITQVSSSEYDVSKHGHALTVGELIEHRKFNPSQAFDSQITQVVRANLGMTKINDWITKIIKSVGSADTTNEAYTDLASYVGQEAAKRPTESQLKALQDMYGTLQQLGPEAIFKTTDRQKQKNLEEGLTYISAVLPRDMRTQLAGRYVANGGNLSDTGKYMQGLIAAALSMNDDTINQHRIDYESTINKATGSASSSDTKKSFYQTPNEAFFDGDLNQMDIKITDNSNKNAYGVNLKGTRIPALTTDNGNAVSNLPMSIALNKSVGKYLEKDQIYMGQQKVGEGMLNNIAYSNSPAAAVYLPVDGQGNIDWAGFKAFSQAEEEIKRNHITDPQEKNQIHAAHHSYAMYDKNNNIIETDNVQRFLMTYGYTIDDHVDDSNDLVYELTGDEEKYADSLIGSIYNKNVSENYGIKKISNKQVWDDIVKVPVFIKINHFASGDSYRYAGHGSNMKPRSLQEDMIQEQLNAPVPQQDVIYGSSALLYQE